MLKRWCLQRRTSCEAKGSGNSERQEQRDTLTSHPPSIAFTRSFEGRRSGLGVAPPSSESAARIRGETSRSPIVVSPTRVKRHASTELAPHASGTSTATSSLG